MIWLSMQPFRVVNLTLSLLLKDSESHDTDLLPVNLSRWDVPVLSHVSTILFLTPTQNDQIFVKIRFLSFKFKSSNTSKTILFKTAPTCYSVSVKPEGNLFFSKCPGCWWMVLNWSYLPSQVLKRLKNKSKPSKPIIWVYIWLFLHRPFISSVNQN